MKAFKTLYDLLQAFSTERECLKYVGEVRWKDGIICPHCKSDKYYAFKDGVRYKCANSDCYKQFNAKTGTFMEGSKLPLKKWFFAIYIFTSHKKGISSHQLAKDIGITQKSAWYVLTRIRCGLKEDMSALLDGVTEIDETFVGGRDGNKHDNRKVYLKNGQVKDVKSPVIGIACRGGKVSLVAIKAKRKNIIFPIILKRVKNGSTIITDSLKLYTNLKNNYHHETVNHNEREYVRGEWYTNTVEGLFSQVKRAIIGVYHHASKKHLQGYCNEIAFRYNTRKLKEVDRFCLVLTVY